MDEDGELTIADLKKVLDLLTDEYLEDEHKEFLAQKVNSFLIVLLNPLVPEFYFPLTFEI